MPAEQINLLYRYRGGGNTKPKLSKMGGAAWENTKNKAKGEVKEIAYDLLKLYAKREMSQGIAFEPDTGFSNIVFADTLSDAIDKAEKETLM